MIKPNFAPITRSFQPNLSIDPLVGAAKLLGRLLWALMPGPFLLFLGGEAVIQASLGVRLFYAFEGGEPSGKIVEALYGLSGTLVAPFASVDGDVAVSGSGVFHLSTVVAMDVYLLAGIATIVTYTVLRSGFGIVRWQVRRAHRRHRPARVEAPTQAPLVSEAVLSDQVA